MPNFVLEDDSKLAELFELIRFCRNSNLPSLKEIIPSASRFQKRIEREYREKSGKPLMFAKQNAIKELWRAAKEQGKGSRQALDAPYFSPGGNQNDDTYYGDLLRELRTAKEAARIVSPEVDRGALIYDTDSMDKKDWANLLLSPQETAALDRLQDAILEEKEHVGPLKIPCRPYDGFHVLGLGLCQRFACETDTPLHTAYERIILVALSCPKESGVPNELVNELFLRLGVQPGGTLVDAINEQRVLVIVCGSEELLTDNSKPARDLIESDQKQTTFVLFYDADRRRALDQKISGIEHQITSADYEMPRVNVELLNDRENRSAAEDLTLAFFTKLVRHYETLHAEGQNDPTDYRYRLAEWAFSEGAQPPRPNSNGKRSGGPRPCDVRLRAFLSANRNVFSMEPLAKLLR